MSAGEFCSGRLFGKCLGTASDSKHQWLLSTHLFVLSMPCIVHDVWYIVQVSGMHVVPTSLQKQNFITDTLLTLLASDHVFLIRLTAVDETTLPDNQGSATMTYIMQKSSDTVAIGTVGSTLNPCTTLTIRVYALVVQHHW